MKLAAMSFIDETAGHRIFAVLRVPAGHPESSRELLPFAVTNARAVDEVWEGTVVVVDGESFQLRRGDIILAIGGERVNTAPTFVLCCGVRLRLCLARKVRFISSSGALPTARPKHTHVSTRQGSWGAGCERSRVVSGMERQRARQPQATDNPPLWW